MEEIKEFVEKFLKVEAEARYAFMKPNESEYQRLYDEIHSFTVPSLKETLSLIKDRSGLNHENFYKNYENFPTLASRYFYKLSHYENSKYGDLWIAYLSEENPDADWKDLRHAFVITKEKKELKIAQIFLYIENEATEEGNWKSARGYKDISNINNLGEFIKTERYLKPEDEDETMNKYLEDC